MKVVWTAVIGLCLAFAATAGAQTSTGLPAPITWTFHFDASWGTFGFANSLYDNPREPVREDLSDQWFEGTIKPALSGVYTFKSSSELYGAISAVGERTYGSVPDLFGHDVSSFGPEDLSIGWRSGKSLAIGENALDFTVGRAQYRLGNCMLLCDGAAEGGSRGGYWSNARKAFELAAIGRFKPGRHTVEAFYLDKDELDEGETGTRLWGVNYEVKLGADDATTLGATYMKFMADPSVIPSRDGLNVFNARAYTAPIVAVPDLSFEFEYAAERNAEARDADAWTLQGMYQFSGAGWKPSIAYRYAFFEGDDPATVANENFDPLLVSWTDWGAWFQGEIAGAYFLANSNLVTNRVRLHVDPSDKIGAGVMFYKFALDQPRAIGARVTAKDIAVEGDVYVDWTLNDAFTVSFVGAYANPGEAIRQTSGRTKNFAYGLVYVAYSF